MANGRTYGGKGGNAGGGEDKGGAGASGYTGNAGSNGAYYVIPRGNVGEGYFSGGGGGGAGNGIGGAGGTNGDFSLSGNGGAGGANGGLNSNPDLTGAYAGTSGGQGEDGDGGGGGGAGGYGLVSTAAGTITNGTNIAGGNGGNGGRGMYGGGGGDGGVGFRTTHTSTTLVNNSGQTIQGGLGGQGGEGESVRHIGMSGSGGTGYLQSFAGTLSNTGNVDGGTGGAGGNEFHYVFVNGPAQYFPGTGGSGGSGGSGVQQANGSHVINTGAIFGGIGGVGGTGGSSNGNYTSGAGGTGGTGVVGYANATIDNGNSDLDSIIGGVGGAGGAKGGAGTYGAGGAGGTGVTLAASTGFTNAGFVGGGIGGYSGPSSGFVAGDDPTSNSLAGGAGGTGVYAAGGASFANAGAIEGGFGGDGLAGGVGGAAVALGTSSTAATSFTNNSTVEGGRGGYGFQDGGAGGAGLVAAPPASASFVTTVVNAGSVTGGFGYGNAASNGIFGAGGAGIVGAGLTLENTGSIAGGFGGAGSVGLGGKVQADALTFQSGANTLALGAKSSIGGAVDVQAGTLSFDQTVLSGAPTSLTLANTIIGAGAIIQDTSGGTLTLTGTNTFTGGTTFAAGELDVGSAAALGSSGTLSFTGGSLQFSASNTTDYSGRFSTTAGQAYSIDTNGQSVTFASALTSSGGTLTKLGAGTLTLEGTNTYTGGTTIDAGTLAVSADANLGKTTGGLTLGNGTLEATAGFTSTRAVTITGVGYVQVDNTGTLTLSGAIGGNAPQLFKTGAGTLVLGNANNTYDAVTTIDAGTLSIAADGDLGASNGLMLAGGTLETTATLTSARTIDLTAASTVQVDDATTTTLSGRITGGSSDTLTKTGAGTLALSDANNTFGNTKIDAGTLDLLQSHAGGGGAITFAGTQATPATLMLASNAQPGSGGTFGNTLTNFAANDALDLEGVTYSVLDTAIVTTKGSGATAVSTLTFTDNSNIASPKTENFTLSGTHDAVYAVQRNAGGTGVLIEEAVCFAGGTRIRVLRDGREADVAVEELVVGDVAITASGDHRPITWLGHREIDCAMARVPSDVWPVRIRAGAFGDDRPARELRLSPGHPVLVGSGEDEHLVPIMCLINGLSIERVETPAVTYWHVELDEHDILLAENLPAESYIDLGSRPWFAGADGALTDPDLALPEMPGRCRPVAIDGPLVEAEQRRVDGVFATSLSMDCAWPTIYALSPDLGSQAWPAASDE